MIIALLSLLLATSDTGPATAVSPAVTAAEPAGEPKKERKICKREQISTSLHGSKRICLTAREWKARELNASLEDLGGVSTK
ncbi:MAG TPA: hypothetical protein VNA29_03370 [Sphingomicrobium sp.]|nr:hypothetical protein [Sphingomicrobium sp.]